VNIKSANAGGVPAELRGAAVRCVVIRNPCVMVETTRNRPTYGSIEGGVCPGVGRLGHHEIRSCGLSASH